MASLEFGERIDLVNNELHRPIVQAGALTALRMAGMEAQVEACAVGGYDWLRVRALFQRSKMANWDARAAERVREGFSERIQLQRAFHKLALKASPAPGAPTDQPPAPKMTVELSGADLIQALKSGGALPDGDVLRLDGQHLELMHLIDPGHDSVHVVTSQAPPALHLRAGDGRFTVREVKSLRSDDNASKLRKKLRALLVAAWPPGEPPPAWHARRLSDHEYALHYLKAMAAAGRADLLLQELETTRFAEVIEPYEWREARPILDARLIPILARLAPAGTDRGFLSVCGITAQVDGPGIVEVLTDPLSLDSPLSVRSLGFGGDLGALQGARVSGRPSQARGRSELGEPAREPPPPSHVPWNPPDDPSRPSQQPRKLSADRGGPLPGGALRAWARRFGQRHR
jgi:hypothetical protein